MCSSQTDKSKAPSEGKNMELLKEIYNTNDVDVQVGAASTKAATGNVQLNKYLISVRIMVLAFPILVQQPS